MNHTLIRNTQILDGSGAPAFRADILLKGDQIAAIAASLHAVGATVADDTTVVDGTGLTATPGFIDMHSHSDFTLPINPRAESKIRQGVTTEVIGMCGASPAPLNAETKEQARAGRPELPWTWESFAEYLDYLRQTGISVNVVPLVGHGTIRSLVVGPDDRAPSAKELEEMKRQVAQAMDEGAWGLSSGLIYPPSAYATTDELIALSRVPAARGGFYFSHIRNENESLLDAVSEAIAIGEQAGLPVQIAHFKAMQPQNWHLIDDALALLVEARARGVDVAADRYPYIASSTSLRASLPNWAHDGGLEALLQRLADPETRARILDGPLPRGRRWDTVVVAHAPDYPEWEGRSVADIAAQRGANASETALDMLLEAKGRVSVVHFAMEEEGLKRTLRHPCVMVGSDGSALAPYGPLGEGKAHPRSYGTFVRVLGKYAREEETLTLPEAVAKMTGIPAARLGLSDRGLLEVGRKADLVLLNPKTVIDRATFTEPYQYPEGIAYVFVNGTAVVTPEGHTGALPGAILTAPSSAPSTRGCASQRPPRPST
jgi:N-acyl-D-amino-acid deacylase